MSQHNIKNILENIISLTSERDSNALELALAQTLFKLAAPESISLFKASSIDHIKYESSLISEQHALTEVPADILDALKECLETGKTIYTQQQAKNLSLFPLLNAKKQPIAVIMIESAEDSQDHALTVMVLKIYHNFVALMNENERDTLTGLLNRKTFDVKINGIIAGLQETQRRRDGDSNMPHYLAIFDIDHFKRVNDSFGHLMGDEVLLLFSQIMEKSFRDKDLLFRFGGEEFVGVFQCPNDETMLSVLNRFRANVEKHSFPQVGKVTVSCGFTKINPFDLSSSIIDRADVALYHAKNNGRNQVCQHEVLVASGLLARQDNTGDIELF